MKNKHGVCYISTTMYYYYYYHGKVVVTARSRSRFLYLSHNSYTGYN